MDDVVHKICRFSRMHYESRCFIKEIYIQNTSRFLFSYCFLRAVAFEFLNVSYFKQKSRILHFSVRMTADFILTVIVI